MYNDYSNTSNSLADYNVIIYNDEKIEKIVDDIKTLIDLNNDLNLKYTNEEALRQNNKELIRRQLNLTVERFKDTANETSIFTGMRLVYMPNISEEHIIFTLRKLTENIYFYIAYENAKDEVIKYIRERAKWKKTIWEK